MGVDLCSVVLFHPSSSSEYVCLHSPSLLEAREEASHVGESYPEFPTSIGTGSHTYIPTPTPIFPSSSRAGPGMQQALNGLVLMDAWMAPPGL